MIFDSEGQQIGFSPAVDIELEEIKEFNKNILIITVTILALLIIMIIMCVAIYFCVHKKDSIPDQQKKNIEIDV